MSVNFNVEIRQHEGNLHVRPEGDFDGSAAWELIHSLYEHYNGEGSVYIDTGKINDLCPFGVSTFRCFLNLRRIPANRLIFKGLRGHDMAPKGSKVVADEHMRECQCSGDCEICPYNPKTHQKRV